MIQVYLLRPTVPHRLIVPAVVCKLSSTNDATIRGHCHGFTFDVVFIIFVCQRRSVDAHDSVPSFANGRP